MILDGKFKDLRNGSEHEQRIANFVYLPMVIIYVLICMCSVYPFVNRFYKFWIKKDGDPDQSMIDMVDNIGIFDFTMK